MAVDTPPVDTDRPQPHILKRKISVKPTEGPGISFRSEDTNGGPDLPPTVLFWGRLTETDTSMGKTM